MKKIQCKRAEINVPRNAFLIMSTGELNDNKNHSVIVKAIAKLNDKNIHYIIAGKGDNENKLKELSTFLGIADQVHILGFREDINDLLKASDCFAFPSKREGLGLAAIEAMASGLPVLTSNVGGINDYSVNGVTGYKFDSMDIDGFAKGIKKLKNEADTCMTMGESNKVKAKKIDLSIVEKVMKEVYE